MAASSSSNNSSSAPGRPQDESPGPRQPIATVAGDLVKRREDGELDWETLGKVLTASVLGEALFISYADFKYGRMTRGSNLDIDWKFAYEDKEVIVLRKDVASTSGQNLICFAGRGVINYPVEHVASIIMNINYLNQWNKFLTEYRVVKEISSTESSRDHLLYFLHENNKCFVRARRDFLMYSHSTFREDGKFVNCGISIDHPCCPLVRGTIRANVCLGSGWMLEPYEDNPGKTLVTYIANIDLRTPLSTSLTSRLLESQPLTIYYLKKFVKSLNKVTRGLSPARRTSRIEADLETSLTSTVNGTDSFFGVDSQRCTLYREQMGVDHFMGASKTSLKKHDEFSDEGLLALN
ncbi:uncharacterized protein LOC135348993 isoform X3 [Halichondria panicea]|uniref:uncharacterized protein LOC135348993 isoform X3 n=1 Tax=Halichondria panicea TaxID=6063 RepID=UPI00312B8B4F